MNWLLGDFPDPSQSDGQGLVAIGGDLSIDRLMKAYRKGIFPWTDHPITWWSPDPRGVLPLNGMHIPKTLQRIIKKKEYKITFNQAFEQVIKGCANETEKRPETWISDEFIDAYCQLHQDKHAHSVECWIDDKLAGGLYGVAIGGFFAGESMFHIKPNASSLCLVHLVEHLNQKDFKLLDVQMVTHHTRRFGAVEIPRPEYLKKLDAALKLKRHF